MSTDLSEVIAAHEATNAKLLLRVAELEQSERESEALARAQQREVMSLREQVATLTQTRNELEVERGEMNAALKAELAATDAAKADAARLREAWGRFESWLAIAGGDALWKKYQSAPERKGIDAAVAATDSAAWLESKIAERTVALEARIESLKDTLKDALKIASDDIANLMAQVESLEQQLVAATNDAARAELRARDLQAAIRPHVVDDGLHRTNCIDLQIYYGKGAFGPVPSRCGRCGDCLARAALAASPDSDERLREVVARALLLGWSEGSDESERIKKLVDKVLGVKS